MSIIRREQLVTPLSASYAATASIATSASYAENTGVSIDTGSLVTTSSFNAYTASINSFTSSINTFTASYSTGSFTGSFTGSLLGTSSWAISTSYYQETDPVFISKSASLATTGSNTFIGNQTITGSLLLSGSSLIVSSSILQMPNNIIINSTTRRLNSGSILSVDWGNRSLHNDSNVSTVDWNSSYLLNSLGTTVDWGNYGLVDSIGNYSLEWGSRVLNTSNGIAALDWVNDYVNYSDTYLYRFHDITSQDALVSSVQYTGETISAAVSSSAAQYQLVALSGSYWLPVSQTTDTSTKMLGIALGVNMSPTRGVVLLEGDISFDGTDGPSIQGTTTDTQGLPVYIRLGVVEGRMSIIPPSSGYVRIVGHVYYNNGTGYIFKFKPSNDWYKLS